MDEGFEVRLTREAGYVFDVEYPGKTFGLAVDEADPPGSDKGPNPARLVATAVGHCLSSSLLFCLQKSRVEVGDVRTLVRGRLERNEKGRWRLARLEVEIDVSADDRAKLDRCSELFEDFCIVTQSVRNGLPVDVTVRTAQ